MPNAPPAADVSDDVTTFDASVVPVNVPAAAAPAVIVLQPNPVPVVHVSAFDAPLHEGTARSLGVVAVTAPRTVLAVWFFSVAVTVPVVVTALEGVDERIVPSPVNVTDVTVPLLPAAAGLFRPPPMSCANVAREKKTSAAASARRLIIGDLP